jgi:DNA-binding MarR family transcriptional regulator
MSSYSFVIPVVAQAGREPYILGAITNQHKTRRRAMKFQQLRYLVAVHENGLNITAAARQLHTSQPGVSRQLKLLEE